jgi:hypothetical protein
LPVPLIPTTTIRLPWSEYFAPIDDIPRLRIAYVDRAPELFVRLAAVPGHQLESPIWDCQQGSALVSLDSTFPFLFGA